MGVIKAIKKRIVNNDKDKDLAVKRKKVCLSCDKMESNTCSLCGCRISNLIFGDNKHCKLMKWDGIN